MWFAKWFGNRTEGPHEDDEPARFSAPEPPTTAVTKVRSCTERHQPAVAIRTKLKKGFDPYNSGAFERKNAWERTNRR